MRIEGILAEKGVQALGSFGCSGGKCSAPRVWIVLSCEEKIEIWRKSCQSLEKIALIEPDQQTQAGQFVEELSAWLIDARDQEALERIILVAPERTLNTFHQCMPTDMLACVAAEIPKDLSNVAEDERLDALSRLIFM